MARRQRSGSGFADRRSHAAALGRVLSVWGITATLLAVALVAFGTSGGFLVAHALTTLD